MAPMTYRTRSYTIGWITTLSIERAAATVMLDEVHEKPSDFTKHSLDENSYSWGRLGDHNVVVTSLPAGEHGMVSAVITASGLLASLPHIRIGLLVGIGAGVPSGTDILLGDVVVSSPDKSNGGVVQYDMYKAQVDGGLHQREQKGFLDAPPRALRSALSALQAEHELSDSHIPEFLDYFKKNARMTTRYAYPGNDQDPIRDGAANIREMPEIHYGTIGSGNTSFQDSGERDALLKRLKKHDIKCLETEAAGLMNNFPCIVIRGICDYADELRNDVWKRYAAATAACFAKELLGYLDAQEVEQCPRIDKLIEKVDHVKNEVEEVNTRVGDLFSVSQTMKLKQWLGPADCFTNYNEALSKHHEGTGRWFIDSDILSYFGAGNLPAIWLYGRPGSGKTVLSSAIIRELLAQRQRYDHDHDVLFFYFDFRDSKKQSLNDVLRTLIFQLYCSHASYHARIDKAISNLSCGHSQPTENDLISLLDEITTPTSGPSRSTIIVLDALDECRTLDRLLSWIAGSQCGSRRFCMTSRMEHEIEVSFRNWLSKAGTIPLRYSRINQDIAAFVKARIREDKGFERWQGSPQILQELEDALVEKSDGMFRWAACQLDELRNCFDLPGLRNALRSLPRDLDETYARVLAAIPKAHRRYTTRLLQFLLHSPEMIRLAEVVDILAVYPDQEPMFDRSNRMPVAMDVTKYCPGLIQVTSQPQDPETLRTNRHPRSRIVQLAHFTVKEYLLSETVEQSYRVALSNCIAHTAIAEVYLAYFWTRYRAGEFAESSWAHWPLQRLASFSWLYHAKYMDPGAQRANAWIESLFNDTAAYAAWQGMCGSHAIDPRSSNPPPLAWAAHYGLRRLVERLLELGHDANATFTDQSDPSHRTWTWLGVIVEYFGPIKGICPLAVAASQGHADVALALLDAGANANLGNWSVGFPMGLASANGNYGTVRLLIERGASLQCRDSLGTTPLHSACAGGHDKVIQLLIDKGMDINASKNGFFGTPLSIAVKMGHIASARLLRKNGATIGPALLEAAQLGDKQSIHSLLSNGFVVDIDRAGSGNVHDGNALEGACCNGNKSAVQLLLSFGANVNFQSKSLHGNALVAAVWSGELDITKYLIYHGAALETPGTDGDNALQVARKKGRHEIATLLLQHGANVDPANSGHSSRPIIIADERP